MVRLPARFWLELAFAAASGALFLVTLFARTWIEQLFGIDPDHGSGALEWTLVAAFFAITVLLGTLARSEWRRVHAAA